ncbi:hypothetical protein PAHAL_3G065500 [Panicum hallii]|jgi:hypothetical protein|uniref:DUF4220 domain-containing protein n=2 Tax=Panicum hallii TaxID=206008 RepID=A0A2T8KHD7_9POAL|nr:hypothetical protein PAHAL_3G065500 [Panicum hallii]
MVDLADAMIWWDKWQLRVLVLGSLILQWFLLLAAPMRKYVIPRCFRTWIWLAYISSDALAIYALATLFNRHARATGGEQASPLEVLWAPILLIHLGGQQELTAYEIEDNELWTRHTVTLVSQVTVAVYAFYKAWPRTSDRRLLASAILLFITGFLSFCEKPWALYRARINRLADVSSMLEEPSRSVGGFCFTELKKRWAAKSDDDRQLSERDKVHMILSDLSLYAAADDLKQALKRLDPGADVSRWLRKAFGLIYTRANVVTTPAYMAYHLLLVPSLHATAIALFATIPNKHGRYDGTDVKMTYILICLTAALDLLAACIRGLLHLSLLIADVPALCETIPEYNLVDSVLRRMRPCTGCLLKCATQVGFSEEYFNFRQRRELYSMVKGFLVIDLLKVEQVKGLDLSTYRSFSGEARANWALGDDLRMFCSTSMKRSLRTSFDKSVLTWHIATDLCFRMLPPQDGVHADGGVPNANGVHADRLHQQRGPYSDKELHLRRQLCTQAISNYMAHLLNFRPEMLMTGSRKHLFTRAQRDMERILDDEAAKDIKLKLQKKQHLDGEDLMKIKRQEAAATPAANASKHRYTNLVHEACKLAEELMRIEEETQWHLMYRVWVGMLCYSASMCRGYLHAKSLGEGGEFLSVVWLIISLKGAKTLADKLQMPETEEGDWDWNDVRVQGHAGQASDAGDRDLNDVHVL